MGAWRLHVLFQIGTQVCGREGLVLVDLFELHGLTPSQIQEPGESTLDLAVSCVGSLKTQSKATLVGSGLDAWIILADRLQAQLGSALRREALWLGRLPQRSLWAYRSLTTMPVKGPGVS